MKQKFLKYSTLLPVMFCESEFTCFTASLHHKKLYVLEQIGTKSIRKRLHTVALSKVIVEVLLAKFTSKVKALILRTNIPCE